MESGLCTLVVRWAERQEKVGYMYQADVRARVLRLGLPHIRKLPSHLMSTYDILRVSVLSVTWATGCRALKGTTSSGKAQGTWSNRSIRVQALHCTNQPASLKLHCSYGNFRQGHPSSTTSFWSTSFDKLHKQRSASSGCVSVFRKLLSFSL